MKTIILHLLLIGAILSTAARGGTVSLGYLEGLLLKRNPTLLEKEKEIEILKGSLEYLKDERESSHLTLTATYYPSEEYAKEVAGYRYGLTAAVKAPVIKKSFFKKPLLEALILEKEAEYYSLKRKLLTELRQAYVDYYYYRQMKKRAQESIDNLLVIKDIIRERIEEKLALWSELLSVESNLVGIETSKIIFREKEKKALSTIRELIGNPDLPPFEPLLEVRNPDNAYLPDPTEIYRDSLKLKEVKLLERAFELLRESSQKDESLLTGWLTLSGALTGQKIGDFQKGVRVSFSLSLPLSSSKLTGELEREKVLRTQRELLRAKISRYALITATQIPYRNTLIYQERIESLKASVRAKKEELKTLRLRREAGLTGGTDSYLKEALLTAELFSAEISLLDSRREVVRTLYALKGLTEHSSFEENWERPSARELQAYFWHTEGLIGKVQRERELLEKLVKLGIRTVYLSLNGKQIEEFLNSTGGNKKLKEFIRRAHDRGIEVQLLLGENTWIYPENRDKLLEIVELFNRFNIYAGRDGFSALHLDVEPHALPGWKESKGRLAELYIETLNEVKNTCEKPVFADISPQYDGVNYGEESLTEAVIETVNGVNVMCYSTNINHLKRKARQYARLSLRELKPVLISLSVERELPPSESFFRKPKEEFEKAVRTIRLEGIKAVAVQNLTDFIAYTEGEKAQQRPKRKKRRGGHIKLVFLNPNNLPKEIAIR